MVDWILILYNMNFKITAGDTSYVFPLISLEISNVITHNISVSYWEILNEHLDQACHYMENMVAQCPYATCQAVGHCY
jgi:hypothetical protein